MVGSWCRSEGGGVVARPASVFVRELSPEEAVKLRRISRQSKVFALRQRAQIVLASDARSSAPEIARVLQTDENQVRRVIGSSTPMGWRRCALLSGADARGGSMTRPGRRSAPSLSPVPVISVSPAPAGRWRRCAATWSATGSCDDLQGASAADPAVAGHHGAADPDVEVEQRPAVRREEGLGAGRLPGRPRPAPSTGWSCASTSAGRSR